MSWSVTGAMPGLLLYVLLSATGAPALGAESGGDQREIEGTAAEAVVLARSGRHEDALRLLAKLRAAAPDDIRLIHDETTVLGWAERDEAVLRNARLLDGVETPAYVAITIAKSARNLGRYGDAAAWYRRALELAPAEIDARVGLAMTLADGGDAAAAAAVLDVLPPEAAQDTSVLLARAYVEQRADRPLAALTLYEQVLAAQPRHEGALRGKALMLRALLLPGEALAVAALHPGVLTDAEIARLEADEAALKVRLTSGTPYPADQRDAAHREMLARLDRVLDEIEDPAARAAVQADRIVALYESGRSHDAIEQFEQLRRSGQPVPPHAARAAAAAHLRLRRADDAVELLRAAAEAAPDDTELRFDLVFAYLEAERHDEALALARALAERFPLVAGDASRIAYKEQRLRAGVLVALVEAYTDQLADAQARLEALAADAPNNPDVRHELANVYRWRGWLDRSESEYRRVLSAHPDQLGARVGFAHTRLDAAAFDEVGRAVDELNAAYPDDPGVTSLHERFRLERRGELTLGLRSGQASGATFGNEQLDWTAGWVTAPIGRVRGVARYDDLAADFPEGDGGLRRFGAGAEYRADRWSVTGLLSGRSGGGVGLLTTADWRLDDHWRLNGIVDLDSAETPLRGRRVGTEGNVFGFGAEYRANEGAAVAFGWRYRDLSDGNAGASWFADARKRLLNEPRWKLDLTGELNGSRNDRDDVPYFSPRRDRAALLGARHEWRLFRRYDSSVVQLVEAGAGWYDQAGYPGGRIWRARYALRFELGPAVTVEGAALRSRMFYDGLPEYGTFYTLDLAVRL